MVEGRYCRMHVNVIHHNLTERYPHCGHFEHLLNSKTENKIRHNFICFKGNLKLVSHEAVFRKTCLVRRTRNGQVKFILLQSICFVTFTLQLAW